MDAVARLEHLCADALPALVERPLGQWRLRASGGFTGRANCTLVAGDPGIDPADALELGAAFAREHGLPARAHAAVGDPVETVLARRGWRVDHGHSGPTGVMVMTGPLDWRADPADCAVLTRPSRNWWRLATGLPEPTDVHRGVLASGPPIGFGVCVRDGETVAAVRGALVGDLLHVSRLAVADQARGQGCARRVLAELAAWGRARGAVRCVLQVTATNVAAVTLYDSLGCVEHHRYQYWVKPSPDRRRSTSAPPSSPV